ncbi:MAG: hypothetical protein VKN33_05885 [Candidatus Sericytochromatia bacterium]|nr:hypothetical protein [Candidatus Sericytochromatia bacterium]
MGISAKIVSHGQKSLRQVVTQASGSQATAAVVRKAPLMLPPAASVREVGRGVRWLDQGWTRHENMMRRLAPAAQKIGDEAGVSAAGSALQKFHQRNIARHNAAVMQAGRRLETFSNGPIVRAASRDLGRTARALDGPVKATGGVLEFIYYFMPFRPVFDRLSILNNIEDVWELLKKDPNSVRRWVRDLGQKLPTF